VFRLSKKTDYALMALQYLASSGASGVVSARAIAERFDIPLELLAKILQQLAHQGLVAAHKGIHGGYQLARPALAISVADVAEAIDGPMTLTACSHVDVRCEQFATCTVRDPLWQIRERILSVLQTVTVADMDDQARRPVPLTVRKEPEVPVQAS
jgi:Rrf2 family transcriptional regulator, iron-sulfur cluster assembly transcription factor